MTMSWTRKLLIMLRNDANCWLPSCKSLGKVPRPESLSQTEHQDWPRWQPKITGKTRGDYPVTPTKL